MDIAEQVINQLLAAMGLAGASASRSEVAGQTVFSIKTTGDARDLIGPRGDTIHAIDTLVKKIVEQKLTGKEAPEGSEHRLPMFLVDVDEYRTRQIKDIQMKAKMMAERARSFQYDVELSPMSAYERLIVHTALQDEPNVKTESQGEGRNRRVVIKYSVS
ncbi:MAG TPA: R3H domain-containing nucleic acid-binding protein [Candidatus Paceibacterota bacterium]|nr:R3H domain-containing nucleic acid-binding protein [Candidatus Paceibacterota bacterium]